MSPGGGEDNSQSSSPLPHRPKVRAALFTHVSCGATADAGAAPQAWRASSQRSPFEAYVSTLGTLSPGNTWRAGLSEPQGPSTSALNSPRGTAPPPPPFETPPTHSSLPPASLCARTLVTPIRRA
jgi:hypothetical protein